jgi:hypothetical protein
MAQRETPEEAAAANASPAAHAMGDLALSAERRAVLEPKLRALLHEFQHLERLARPDVEPWYARPLAPEAADAR